MAAHEADVLQDAGVELGLRPGETHAPVEAAALNEDRKVGRMSAEHADRRLRVCGADSEQRLIGRGVTAVRRRRDEHDPGRLAGQPVDDGVTIGAGRRVVCLVDDEEIDWRVFDCGANLRALHEIEGLFASQANSR